MINIFDDNFLNGKLIISIDEDRKLCKAVYETYDIDMDEIITISSYAKCSDSDTFSKDYGIKILKNKIAKKYYNSKRNFYRDKIRELYKKQNHLVKKYEKYDTKISSIDKYLSKF